jgi:hypothetical protein
MSSRRGLSACAKEPYTGSLQFDYCLFEMESSQVVSPLIGCFVYERISAGKPRIHHRVCYLLELMDRNAGLLGKTRTRSALKEGMPKGKANRLLGALKIDARLCDRVADIIKEGLTRAI